MTMFSTMTQNADIRPQLPDPASAPELFDGLLTRRVTAYFIDVVILGALVLAITLLGTILGFFTFGLAWVSLVFALPVAIVVYYAVTLGSPRRATVGMQMTDIVLTPTRGQPLDGWMAILHALVFWVTIWICWPVTVLFALFTPRRQMIHDLVMGTLMVRRSPMIQHWQRMRASDQYGV
ncbi:RDD family protein [Devosia sediminis]|uniref:RDD family protein n=1 Tax=Devosia sediminis TaxID=2798801 RepID=A0A934J042_9HYPH|nr:RDD family protein [Devosia sediminis]MBJ3785412.1 RDD family protein [Devosia sediminis]